MKLEISLLVSPSFANHVSSLKGATQYFSSSQSKYHQTAKSLTEILFALCTQTKSEVYRVRMTVGGKCLDAYQDVNSPVVGTLDSKLNINSTISDGHKGARYCTAELKDFFLCSTMQLYQYMRIHQCYTTWSSGWVQPHILALWIQRFRIPWNQNRHVWTQECCHPCL